LHRLLARPGLQGGARSAASIFLLGDTIGHVKQMLIAGNFAPGNAGVPFYMDIICPTLAITTDFKIKDGIEHFEARTEV
jgi:hypothetical protein